MAPTKRPGTNARPSKKTKKQKSTAERVVLGVQSRATGDAENSKDADELALEEAVFGRSTKRSKDPFFSYDDDHKAFSKSRLGMHSQADENEDADMEPTGLERLRDENLFFFDAPEASTSKTMLDDTHGDSAEDEDEHDLSRAKSAFPDDFNDDSEDDQVPVTPPSPKRTAPKPKHQRHAAWHDPADEELTVSLTSVSRLRKLRTAPGEDLVTGLDYENRLRRQFEKLHPPPAWATEARKKVLKRKTKELRGDAIGLRNSDDDDSDSEADVDNLFNSAKQTSTVRRGVLEPSEIEIDRVRDANQAESSSSGIVSIGFNPRAQVLFSATADRRLRLFQIDGTENPLIQTLHVPELPISTAAYHPSGSSVLMTGNRPFFMLYDLQSGQVIRSPRGLLTGGLGGSDKQATGGQGGLERFKFSQDGDMLAVGGRRGYVHLVDWSAGGVSKGGQVFGEVKMNVAVKGIAWQRDGKELLTLGEDSEVYVWDVGTRKCITRWKDEGGFGACTLETDNSARYTAVGSTTGIVNLYDPSSTVPDSGAERKAFKAIGNLTTMVTSMKFNHDSQLLALASRTNKDQLKLASLVHLPTATVYQNWPTQQTPLHHVTAVDFSKGSEWLAVGNARGKVLLYTIKAFTPVGSSSKRR
ncbi:U3 snoRNP protein [Microbotryomycetes sp. JL201]|nr:U3 snoRNP protein [Microbotryomycetes sp. JL201]